MRYYHNILLYISGIMLSGIVLSMPVARADPAPQFTLPTDTGHIMSSDLQGKVVYLDFWASWCVPCKKSFPWFNEIQQRYKNQGLVIIAVNMDQEKEDAEKFLARFPADFIIAYDPNGDVATRYNVVGMPSSYLIDRKGELSLTHLGFREKDKDTLQSAIVNLLHQ